MALCRRSGAPKKGRDGASCPPRKVSGIVEAAKREAERIIKEAADQAAEEKADRERRVEEAVYQERFARHQAAHPALSVHQIQTMLTEEDDKGRGATFRTITSNLGTAGGGTARYRSPIGAAMTDSPGNPPIEVQRAAETVQRWLDSQKAPASQPAVKPMSFAERLDRCRQFDQSKMPAWKDPRS